MKREMGQLVAAFVWGFQILFHLAWSVINSVLHYNLAACGNGLVCLFCAIVTAMNLHWYLNPKNDG